MWVAIERENGKGNAVGVIDIKAGRSRILGGIRASHAIIPLRLSSTFDIEIRFTAPVTRATDNLPVTFHSLR